MGSTTAVCPHRRLGSKRIHKGSRKRKVHPVQGEYGYGTKPISIVETNGFSVAATTYEREL